MKTVHILTLIAAFFFTFLLNACSAEGINLPRVVIPGLSREARNFGEFSGVTIGFDGNLIFDKLSSLSPDLAGNVFPLFNIELQDDRLIFHFRDGRAAADFENLRLGLDLRDLLITIKFSAAASALEPAGQSILYVGPNLVDCVGVAPQQCMLVRENPEDDWKYFYDQIEGFDYEEGYLYKLLVLQEIDPNPPADRSSISYRLVNVEDQVPLNASLTDTTWLLEKLNGEAPIQDSQVTATFDTVGKLYGSAGCNSYTTTYLTGGETISIKLPAVTMMFCAEPEGVMDQEQLFLKALEAANTYEIVGNRLTLMDEAGEGILVFRAQER
jgi:heat shock protein HslJ